MRAPGSLELSRVKSALFVRIRSLGDTVLFTPAVTNFKRACPDCRLSVIVDEASASLLENNPDIDEIITSPTDSRPDRVLRFLTRLLRRRFDLAIDSPLVASFPARCAVQLEPRPTTPVGKSGDIWTSSSTQLTCMRGYRGLDVPKAVG